MRTVGIVGLGYVGLPLALAFCDRGIKVLGFDIDTKNRNDSCYKYISNTYLTM